MKILLLVCLFCHPALARENLPVLRSADGSRSLQARPVAVEGDKIKFKRKDGTKFVAPPERFSPEDCAQLLRWSAAMKKHSHGHLLERVGQARAPDGLKVLFVGNSYSFKLPKTFASITRTAGKKVSVAQVTKGGWTLAKHANSKQTMDRISGGKWDVVVLQEQSQIPAFPEHQRSQLMDPAVKKLVDAVRAADAIPVLFLTWGRKDGDKQNAAMFPNDSYEAMQKRLSDGYQKAAGQVGNIHIIPVGKVWSKLRQTEPNAGLYSPDGSHPSERGTYLAGCTFYSAFFNTRVEKSMNKIRDTGNIHRAAASACLVPLPYPLAN